MARGFCSGALAAGTLATLALAAPAHAGEFGRSHACSRADAHSGRAIASVEAPEDAALAAEALRALPAAPTSSRTSPAAFGAPVAAPPDEHARVPRPVPAEFATQEDGTARSTAEDAPPDAAAALEHSAALDVDGPPEAAPLAFRDYRAPRERFRSWRELRVLRLWDNARMTVWFGLDRRGRPGVHFRQRNPGEAIPLAHAEPYVAPPPLRSVPLTSP
jgi:hypothetical protein